MMENGGEVAKFSLILLGCLSSSDTSVAVGCYSESGSTDSAFVISSACYRPLIDSPASYRHKRLLSQADSHCSVLA